MKCGICGFEPHMTHLMARHVKYKHHLGLEDYYNAYVGSKGQCVKCGKHTKFISLGFGYERTCSMYCKCSLGGSVTALKHPEHRFKCGVFAKSWAINHQKGKTYEEIYGNIDGTLLREKLSVVHTGVAVSESQKTNQSKVMKAKILSGEFTPKSNNRRTCKNNYILITNSGKTTKFRSSWEITFVKFLKELIKLDFDKLGYETLRLPYFCTRSNKNRVYIVDFHIPMYNCVIEIKPTSIFSKDEDKLKSLRVYGEENNVKVFILSEIDLANNFKKVKEYVDHYQREILCQN